MIALDRVKACSNPECREVLPADPDHPELAAFWPRVRSGTVVGWQGYCKPCSQRKNREYRAGPGRERTAASRARRHRERMDTEPEYREAHLAYMREWRREWLQRPGNRERVRESQRRSVAKRYAEDPEKFRELSRLDYALRRERQGKTVVHHRSVLEGTRPERRSVPFAAWLAAYQRARGLTVAELAGELGLVERRARSLLSGKQLSVSVDVVSRALTEARVVVSVGGRDVVTFDDLYGDEPIRTWRGRA